MKSAIHRYTGLILAAAVTTLIVLLFQTYNFSIIQLFGYQPTGPQTLTNFLNYLFALLVGGTILGLHELTYVVKHDLEQGRGK